MIKGLTRDNHWFTDYSYIPVVFAAPRLCKFEDDEWATNFCYIESSTVLAYSLLTDAPWGAVKLIPYKTHAALDLTLGLISLTAATVRKDKLKKSAFNTLLAMGFTGLIVGALSLIGAKHS